MSKREMKRLLRKKHREPLEGTPFIASVSTSVGNILIPSTSMVYVEAYKGRYIPKPVCELNPGEMAVFKKEGIDLDLESDVEPILIQSPRYRATLPHLFDLDGPEPVTRFSKELKKGVEGDIADQITRATVETCVDRMEAVAAVIQAVLAAHRISRSIGHIKNGWLAGETVAPKDFPQIFAALGVGMPSTAFSALACSEEFARQYALHMTLRRAIMRNLSLIIAGNGKGPASTPGEKHDSGIDTHPELRMVVEHFAHRIDEKFATIRVFGVKKAEGDGEIRGGQLYKGLVTDEADGFEGHCDLNEMAEIRYVLNGLTIRVMDEFIVNHPELLEKSVDYGTRVFLNEELFGFLMERMGHQTYTFEELSRKAASRGVMVRKANAKGDEWDKRFELLHEAGELMLADLESGALDRKYGLPHGTLHALFDTEMLIESSLPRIYTYRNYLARTLTQIKSGWVSAEWVIFKTELEREIEKAGKKILAIYGNVRDPPRTPYGFALMCAPLGISLDRFYEKYYTGEIPNAVFQAALEVSLGKSIDLASRIPANWKEHVLAILRKIGFSNCARLYPGLVGEPEELLR
jgi:hypothetical protein